MSTLRTFSIAGMTACALPFLTASNDTKNHIDEVTYTRDIIACLLDNSRVHVKMSVPFKSYRPLATDKKAQILSSLTFYGERIQSAFNEEFNGLSPSALDADMQGHLLNMQDTIGALAAELDEDLFRIMGPLEYSFFSMDMSDPVIEKNACPKPKQEAQPESGPSADSVDYAVA
jgi:hypothetical protein